MPRLLHATQRCLLLLLLLTCRVLATADHYQYAVTLENSNARLVHLATYAVGERGYFEIALDVTLTIDTVDADKGRTMLHLIVCDTDEYNQFMSLPATGKGSRVSSAVPGYCAMANQTLGDLCKSYPLVDEAKDPFVYRTQTTIAREWTEDADGYTGDGKLYFYIDACETVGGDDGVLRSCLGRSDTVSPTSSKCFACPKNDPTQATAPACSSSATALAAGGCCVPARIKPSMHIQAYMNLCDKNGSCLSADAQFLATFYLALAIAWAVTWLVWATHIRASREAVIDLQTKMKHVPIALCIYAALTCVTLYTDQLLVGTARKLVVNATILSQVFALAIPAEVVVLVAKGWKITRAHLDAREHQYIRFVTIAWAISYAVLKNSVVKHLTVFLIWGVSWSSVVFMVWYNSAFNLNMLLYQIAMVRQMQLDPTRTPVFTKYMLFRRFRGLLGVYMFCSCVIAILGLVSDATNDRWRWTSVAADEVLSFLLYSSLGYTFRCRRFSNLIQAPAPASATTPSTTDATQSAPTQAQASSASVAPVAVRPMPRIEEIPRPKSSMVLVMNPNPHDQSLGTSYLPVNPKPSTKQVKDGLQTRSSSFKKDTTPPDN